MHWIYLSPHLDDVALSCGGLLWEQTQAGEIVDVWSICAGEPPPGMVSPFAESLHERWETPSQAWEHRRDEDVRSCRRLGASARHFSIPDCIYRRAHDDQAFLYDSEESLWGPIHPAEAGLIERLADELAQALSESPQPLQMVSPWTFGGHVDHHLTRAAAELLVLRGQSSRLWYYAEYPYILEEKALAEELAQQGLVEVLFSVSGEGLIAWQDSIAEHASQISTFWPNLEAMRAAIRTYCEAMGGVRLWKPANG